MGKYLNGIMGLVVADALGVPVEFSTREERRADPVAEMREYGTYNQPRGSWSDDSSMALATLESLQHGYNPEDIADRFVRWHDHGEYTPWDYKFDEGGVCYDAIESYKRSGDALKSGGSDSYDNGNGSLMRILPACLYAYDNYEGKMTPSSLLEMIHQVSDITHAHPRSEMACGIYYYCVKEILANPLLPLNINLAMGIAHALAYYGEQKKFWPEMKHYDRLRIISELEEDEIKSGGYVVSTLEAAIWCLMKTGNYRDAVLKAVNLGGDTDTVAAVTGGLAGLYYGADAIPTEWRDAIAKKDWIESLCSDELYQCDFDGVKVVDVHSHILHGIDDGSRNLSESLAHLEYAQKQGTGKIFCTSHNWGSSAERMEKNFNMLRTSAKHDGLDIELRLGAENYLAYGWRGPEGLSMNGTKNMLIEFDPHESPAVIVKIASDVLADGYTPIIAHVERYINMAEDFEYYEKLIEMGCLLQINAFSLVKERKLSTKNAARALLGKKLVSFIGSDTHRLDHRPYDIVDAVRYIYETCEKDYADAVCYGNAERVLGE